MKKQYDSCLYDNELKKLDSDFIWTDANNPELKVKLIRDMNKRQPKSKFTNPLDYVLRFSAVATVLLIVFIIGIQEIKLNHNSGSESSTDTGREYPFDIEPINGDRLITFTVSEQNRIEGITIPLTNESTIPRDISKEVPFISGKPEIGVTKNNDDLILVKAAYPVTNGQPIVVKATENTYGSTQEAKEALGLMYPKSKKISIGNRDAILYNPGDGESSELLIIEDKYLYLIKGEHNESALIKVAEQINFSN
ncbi:DUF4367 domain-containing protein [Bacillus gobiensis]|uniref:DUF4367 domain-containing protein n=1 Tax=Bacillus gobiensis TaxID=1441095 RepID=UPI003D1BA4C9